MRAVHGAADHRADRARVDRQSCPQLQGEGLHALPPRSVAVGQDVVVNLAGLIGSIGWGLWVAALGVIVLRRPIPNPLSYIIGASENTSATPTAVRRVTARVRS